MDKLEKLEKAKAIIEQEIDNLKVEKEQRNDEETEILLESDSEVIEGGIEDDIQQFCGFFCVQATF